MVVANPTGLSETRYWNPSVDTVPHPLPEDAASGFREHLTQAVTDRVGTSTATVSHLSGGLDTGAITAAATSSPAASTACATSPGAAS